MDWDIDDSCGQKLRVQFHQNTWTCFRLILNCFVSHFRASFGSSTNWKIKKRWQGGENHCILCRRKRFIQYILHNHIPWQKVPVNPGLHKQVKLPRLFWQTCGGGHGLLRHSSISRSQSSPANPGGHEQIYPFTRSLQTVPLAVHTLSPFTSTQSSISTKEKQTGRKKLSAVQGGNPFNMSILDQYIGLFLYWGGRGQSFTLLQ